MKQTVERSARVLNYLGLVLIVCGSAFFLVTVAFWLGKVPGTRIFYWVAQIKYCLLGCVILAVGSFVRYLFDRSYEQSWMLRHIDLLIYLYAAVMALYSISLLPVSALKELLRYRGADDLLLTLFLSYVPAIARVCVLLGIGKVIKITLSIINDSRTLV